MDQLRCESTPGPIGGLNPCVSSEPAFGPTNRKPQCPAATQRTSLLDVWQKLCSGDYLVKAHGCTPTHAWLVAEQARTQGLLAVDAELLRGLLLGQPRKALGFPGAPSYSAVHRRLTHSLSRLGLGPAPTAVPLAVVLAAQAGPQALIRDAWLGPLHRETHLLSVERPDRSLPHSVPKACQAIARAFVEGKSRRQMARERGRSLSTINNQATAAFQYFGASGRYELIFRMNAAVAQVRAEPSLLASSYR